MWDLIILDRGFWFLEDQNNWLIRIPSFLMVEVKNIMKSETKREDGVSRVVWVDVARSFAIICGPMSRFSAS